MNARQKQLCEVFVKNLQRSSEFIRVVQMIRGAHGTEGENPQEYVDELVKNFRIVLQNVSDGMKK